MSGPPLRIFPAPGADRTKRRHRLKGDLTCGVHRGERLVSVSIHPQVNPT
ncbi:hypothetical protein [Streptomyces sp. NBC_00467]